MASIYDENHPNEFLEILPVNRKSFAYRKKRDTDYADSLNEYDAYRNDHIVLRKGATKDDKYGN